MITNLQPRLHRAIWLPAAILVVFALQMGLWAADRAPPFEILSVEPASARPGEIVRLNAKVRRDIGRNCGVNFTRALYDGAGYRFDLEGVQTYNSSMLRQMQVRNPSALALSLVLPPNVLPGKASLVTSLDYICNPLHQLWPIKVVSVIGFDILPRSEPK